MTRVTMCLALTLLAPALARGDDTFDLRALVGRAPGVGGRVRLTEAETSTIDQTATRDGKAMPGQKQETSWTRTFVEEVEAVDPDGQPTRKRRTYESYEDKGVAEGVVVTGVVVVLTRAEGERGHWSFAAAEGSSPLPAQLTRGLEKQLKKENARVDQGATEPKLHEALFPPAAQAVGATWPVEVAKAAPMIGLDVADVEVATSTATGTLQGVEEREGRRWVKARVTMSLMLKTLNGRPIPEPVPAELTFDFAVPTDETLEREVHMVHHVDLTMTPQPGVTAHLLVHSERAERRAAP